MDEKIESRIRFISHEMDSFPKTAYVGYSGGKDSSAVLTLMAAALIKDSAHSLNLTVIYCDTGVENPVVDRFAKSSLEGISEEAKSLGLNLSTRVIEPDLNNSFFVRIIGRGYPPPTNSFRWCTKDIRIRPFKTFLASAPPPVLISIGSRMGESQQRDRSMSGARRSNEAVSFYQDQREGFPQAKLFLPIIDFTVSDVWTTLMQGSVFKSIDWRLLLKIYRDGSGECPSIRDLKDKPCAKGRFGCWSCTVVRRDKSGESLVAAGYKELEPFLEFRQWLKEIRNDPSIRCRFRRSGKIGPGPFTLAGRARILEKLQELEFRIDKNVLTAAQLSQISELWDSDRKSSRYTEIE